MEISLKLIWDVLEEEIHLSEFEMFMWPDSSMDVWPMCFRRCEWIKHGKTAQDEAIAQLGAEFLDLFLAGED